MAESKTEESLMNPGHVSTFRVPFHPDKPMGYAMSRNGLLISTGRTLLGEIPQVSVCRNASDDRWKAVGQVPCWHL
jgi:hypothetical protein